MSLTLIRNAAPRLATVTRTGTAGVFRPYYVRGTTTSFGVSGLTPSPRTNHILPFAPRGDQGPIGACTAFATIGAVQTRQLVQGQTPTPLSQKDLYLQCRDEAGTPNTDSGSDTEHCLYTLQSVGACRDAVFSWTGTIVDAAGVAERPPVDAYRDAAEHRFPYTDWSTPISLAAYEASIRADNTVLFGTEVSPEIQAYTEGQVLGAPNFGNIVGGHQLYCNGVIYQWANLPADIFGSHPTRPTGYVDDTRLWVIPNSWGTGFGYNGVLLASDAFLGNPSIPGSVVALVEL